MIEEKLPSTPPRTSEGLAQRIRTPDQRLRVFVSSTLDELAPERRAVRDAITGLQLTPVMFDAGARPYPARELYRAYLSQSDVFVGIYWQIYGRVSPGMEISGLEDEYRLARGKPQLIYIKRPWPEREPQLQAFLGRVRSDDVTSYQKFSTPAELQNLVANDLAQLLTERFIETQGSPVSPSAGLAALPTPRSSLIDRTGEVTKACELLLRDDLGLLTLTGAGGVGKTRLAIEVATKSAVNFAHGVAFVSLAPLRDSGLVVPHLARALQISGDESREPVKDSVLEYLRNRHLLLVLDNAEQLPSMGPELAQILEHAPGLKVILTSREPLQIRGEWTIVLKPLPLADPAHMPDLNTLIEVPAVALFLRRAQEVRPDFTITEDNARDVAQICERLDGLPLALELAASHVNVLAPRVLLAHLSRRLPLLVRGPRDLPERQQTLRNAIAWSYDLLEPTEQRVFRFLSVFSGFGADGATAVAQDNSTDPESGRDTRDDDMLDRLESLVSKNLLMVEPGLEGEPRFVMLPTIREYSEEQLELHGERLAAQDRFVDFLLTLAQAAEPHLRTAERDVWMDRLESEGVNLRAALTFCRDNAHAAQTGLELAGALTLYWLHRGYLREGLSWLQAMLAHTDSADRSHARGKALFGAGFLSWKQGELDDGANYAREALTIFREAHDALWIGYAEFSLGIIQLAQGRTAESRLLLSDCLRIFKETKDAWGEGTTLAFLALDADLRGEHEEARRYIQDGVRLYEALHDAVYGSIGLSLFVALMLKQGEKEQARSLREKFQGLVQQARNRWLLGMFLVSAAFNVQHNYREYEWAEILYQGGLSVWRDIRCLDDGAGIIRALIGLAEIAALHGQEERAGWLFGAAGHISPASGFFRETFNERARQAREHLDPTRVGVFDAAWTEGEATTLEQAVLKATQEAR